MPRRTPMRRTVVVALVMGAILSACGAKQSVEVTSPPPSSCTPSAGGRCAAYVPWSGRIHLSPDGRRLHGIVDCGGTLHATETGDTVTLTLHVSALRPGMMSCARVDVGVTLAQPLGQREVLDGVSGRPIQVAPVKVAY
jgi:hypothetical protein